MDLQTLGAFVSTVGFPVAVACFVLFRLNGKLSGLVNLKEAVEHNTKATTALTRTLAKKLK